VYYITEKEEIQPFFPEIEGDNRFSAKKPGSSLFTNAIGSVIMYKL
jgi:hypothetical protein